MGIVGDGAGVEGREEGFLEIKKRMSVKTPKTKRLVSIHFFMMIGCLSLLTLYLVSGFCFVKVNTTWL